MKKQSTVQTHTENYSAPSLKSERLGLHDPPSSSQDKKCDSCKYRVTLNECHQFKCRNCGTYYVIYSPSMCISSSLLFLCPHSPPSRSVSTVSRSS